MMHRDERSLILRASSLDKIGAIKMTVFKNDVKYIVRRATKLSIEILTQACVNFGAKTSVVDKTTTVLVNSNNGDFSVTFEKVRDSRL